MRDDKTIEKLLSIAEEARNQLLPEDFDEAVRQIQDVIMLRKLLKR